MNDTPPRHPPAEWLQVLAESEADLAAGRIVPGETVLQDLRDSLARLEAQAATQRRRAGTNER